MVILNMPDIQKGDSIIYIFGALRSTRVSYDWFSHITLGIRTNRYLHRSKPKKNKKKHTERPERPHIYERFLGKFYVFCPLALALAQCYIIELFHKNVAPEISNIFRVQMMSMLIFFEILAKNRSGSRPLSEH